MIIWFVKTDSYLVPYRQNVLNFWGRIRASPKHIGQLGCDEYSSTNTHLPTDLKCVGINLLLYCRYLSVIISGVGWAINQCVQEKEEFKQSSFSASSVVADSLPYHRSSYSWNNVLA
eukprot:5048194-Amphidinium_carterae.1